MKTLLTPVIALGFALSTSAIFAQTQQPPQQGTNMDLAALKSKCTELAANEQLKPFTAVVTCKQVLTQWRPSQQVAPPVQIQNTKEIGASFSLKGFAVPFQAEQVDIAPAEAGCNILQQYKLTVPAVDIELDCTALQAVQSLADLCGPAIEERLTADPSIQVEESTGMNFNSCSHQ